VQRLSDLEFSLVFPLKESMRMEIRGGGLTLPFSKLQARVEASMGDPAAMEQLVEVMVLLFGVPPPYRQAERIMLGARVLGRTIAVDASTLERPLEPIRLFLGCRVPISIPSHFMLFVNMQGFRIWVVVESNLPGRSSLPPDPPKPRDDKEEEADDSEEEEWNDRRGKHEKPSDRAPIFESAAGKDGGNKRKSVAV
jgi:hypothetical protein